MRSIRQSKRLVSFGSGVRAPAFAGVAIALALSMLTACGPDAGAASAPVRPMQLPPGALRLQRVQVMDPSGFERPMVAITMLIPAGYRTQGGIVWNLRANETCTSDYAMHWTATSPDGLSAVGFTEGRRWGVTRTPMGTMPPSGGCMQASFGSAREFLEAWARGTYPQMRVLDYRERTDLKSQLQPYADMHNRTQRELPAQGMESQAYADAGELLIAHVVNGTEVRESIATGVTIYVTRWRDYMNPGQVTQEMLVGGAGAIQFVRAPAGRLDFRLADVLRTSMMRASDWSERIAAYNQRKIGNAIDESRIRHGGTMKTLREIEDIRNGAYDSRMLLEDRMQRERIEQIRGVETYRDAEAGGAVQLSNLYDHAWRLRDQTYVLTNDPNFDPTRFGVEAQKLEALP